MKRIILSGIILAALFTGCSSDEPKLDFCDNELSNVMSKRTIDDAISIADQYASNVGSSSRSTALKVDKSNISAIVSTTSRALSDTLMYVVNYEDNNGYLIISASKATEPILAIIDSGNYQED
ncbi:MAG: Spi family protease inhibitor, partial [Muribaculaceae bacterium]|nr:Spi family protease inhibitor [Muribaculaceae bacterium]